MSDRGSGEAYMDILTNGLLMGEVAKGVEIRARGLLCEIVAADVEAGLAACPVMV